LIYHLTHVADSGRKYNYILKDMIRLDTLFKQECL
jgi:hypothetical protein